ncbi:MAG: VTT domain-containing protein [Clostridiales bacterium]|nr:VTT domain-containing protein [Clostridiales bacterium]
MSINRQIGTRDWLHIIIIVLLIGLFAYIGREYLRVFGSLQGGGLYASAENLRFFILSYGHWGLIIMIGLHALHVVVSVIPSMLVQFAGGFIYNMGLGMLSGFIGITLGTACSFYLSRILGRRVVTLFVSEKNLLKLDSLAISPRTAQVLLLLYILPVPKDFIAYFAGLTKIRASRFFFISAVGRLPGMLIATYLGARVLERNYLLLGLATAACAALSLLSFIYREKILKKVMHG